MLAPLPAQQHLHRDGVLGTSLDMVVHGVGPADAEAGLEAALDEIERLRRLLSAWDRDSQVSALNRGETVRDAAPELIEVLGLCERWRERSGGAFDARVGRLVALWQRAATEGSPPERAALEKAVAAVQQGEWRIDASAHTVAPVGGTVAAIDGLAKGYIIDRALAAARQRCPQAGFLLDIGGDVALAGPAPEGGAWRVAVAAPRRPQDNAPPLVTLALRSGAVATSGGYARPLTIDGKSHSHIIDARTGAPADDIASATVVADDCATADALATALCVLSVEDGLRLAARSRVQCLIVTPDGAQHASPGFAARLVDGDDPRVAAEAEAAASHESAHHDVEITLVLKPGQGRRYRRPYVAVWVEGPGGDVVRTIALWGRERRYVSELSHWWRAVDADSELVHAVSRATRSAGEYHLVWDGEDEHGEAIPDGHYTVCIEVCREHGGHTIERTPLELGAAPATTEVPGNRELEHATVRYPAPVVKD